MPLSNRHNLAIYKIWAPFYDHALERFFAPGRRRAFELLSLRPGERVLLLGVGTGSDLPLLPEGVEAVGIDLSPHMLARARAKLPLAGRDIELLQGDAQELLVAPGTFDAVVLNLILSVVPDGTACLRGALQALKPGGRVVVFDKFRPAGRRPSFARRILNIASSFFGTDITRSFEELARGLRLRVCHDEPSLLGGAYRILLIEPGEPAGEPRGSGAQVSWDFGTART